MSFKSARKAAGLTMRQAADRLGISAAAVAQWESGATSPRAKYLLALAALYGVSVDELLADRE